MDETALAAEGALVVAGVAPGTILAQISVALIAVSPPRARDGRDS